MHICDEYIQRELSVVKDMKKKNPQKNFKNV